MELRRYFAVFRGHVLLIVGILIVALMVGWGTAPRAKRYFAQASLYVGPNSLAETTGGITGPLATAQQIIYTYSKMIPTAPIIQAALDRTGGVRSLAVAESEITATQVQFTQLINVQVKDPEPEVAAALANAMVSAFKDKAQGFTGTGSSGGVPSFPVFPFEPATVPKNPLSNHLGNRLLTAGLFGLVIGAAAAFVVEYLDVTIRTARDAANRLELPVLGAVPLQRRA